MGFFLLECICYFCARIFYSQYIPFSNGLSEVIIHILLLYSLAYFLCLILGYCRAKTEDTITILRVVFDITLVDIYVDSFALYLKYNLLKFILYIVMVTLAVYVLKGVI